ncbi:hypothetical protein, partial [Bacteroides uniformis]|uniref:hypothetical protein n=1 Tax=Bacteroides uniformis TaxID=820 RepID=UPI001AA1B7E4
LFKDGVDYIVRAHHKKLNLSLVNAEKIKILVNSSKNFVLLIIKPKNYVGYEAFIGCDPMLKYDLIEVVNQNDDVSG